MITIKRIYEPYDPADGCRILVDRLWPRGIKKTEAHIDIWSKDVAPTSGLRKWFNHEPEKWKTFQEKYVEELKASGAAGKLAEEIRKEKKVTFLYAAKDPEHNQALVLLRYMKKLL